MSEGPREIPVVDYARAAPAAATAPVTLCTCADATEAQMLRTSLRAANVAASELILQGERGGADGRALVEFRVHPEQVPFARALHFELMFDLDQLEPIDPQPPPPVDERGHPVELVTVAVYEHARDLVDAAVVLGAAGIDPILPEMAPRPPEHRDVARRFEVRVLREDAAQAGELLRAAAEENAAAEERLQRCPRCRSWQVTEDPQLLRRALNVLTLGRIARGFREMYGCNRCGCRWEAHATRGFAVAKSP
jgi:hypothetical protein